MKKKAYVHWEKNHQQTITTIERLERDTARIVKEADYPRTKEELYVWLTLLYSTASRLAAFHEKLNRDPTIAPELAVAEYLKTGPQGLHGINTLANIALKQLEEVI